MARNGGSATEAWVVSQMERYRAAGHSRKDVRAFGEALRERSGLMGSGTDVAPPFQPPQLDGSWLGTTARILLPPLRRAALNAVAELATAVADAARKAAS